jgi:diaminopimelate decarboxylase
MANNYNGVPRPPVIFCGGGEARAVVRRESFEDLTARDQDPLPRPGEG